MQAAIGVVAPKPIGTLAPRENMYAGLGLFADLEDADVNWILSSGVEQQIIANTALTLEGEAVDELHIVLEGLLGVRVKAMGAEPIGVLGPGEIGEMSFIERRPASATVQAIENSLILFPLTHTPR